MFKVVLFDIDPGTEPEKAYIVNKAALALNNGHVRCFPFEHSVVAIYFNSGVDGGLSHRKTVSEINEKIYKPFNIESAVSSVFSEISKLNLAYRQAMIALGFRHSIEREQSINSDIRPKGVYIFEDALLYYLVDPTGKDKEFLEFTFSTSITDIMWEEDQENGTDYLRVLWFYLKNERNATITAQELHMHRNTVLYRIDKIQQRFDFDLNQKAARDWMLVCFKSLFSRLSGESLASIFGLGDSELG